MTTSHGRKRWMQTKTNHLLYKCPNDVPHRQRGAHTHQALLQHALDIFQVVESVMDALRGGREGAVFSRREILHLNDFDRERRYVKFVRPGRLLSTMPMLSMILRHRCRPSFRHRWMFDHATAAAASLVHHCCHSLFQQQH